MAKWSLTIHYKNGKKVTKKDTLKNILEQFANVKECQETDVDTYPKLPDITLDNAIKIELIKI